MATRDAPDCIRATKRALAGGHGVALSAAGIWMVDKPSAFPPYQACIRRGSQAIRDCYGSP